MSLQNFIPTLWANELLAALRKAHVYAALCNRDYEGQIRAMGDSVKINAIGDITVSNYSKDTPIAAPQALTDAQTMLAITQAKYFNFAIDDVDKAQQTPKVMAEAMSRAAYGLADAIDIFVAGLYTDIAAGNLIGTTGSPVTPVAPTQANVGLGTTLYDYITVLGQYLTQGNVPKAGRWFVVAPWQSAMLKQDVRFTSFNTEAARQTILSGRLDATGGTAVDSYLGRIDGADLYESNNAPHTAGTNGIAGSVDVLIGGHSMAWTFADGVSETEAFRPPDRFSDAVKGLMLYGAKVTRPYALCAGVFQHP